MQTLTRPKSGRIVTGVAIGFSELYGIRVWMLRIAWLAAMLAWPVAILLYLLFSIAMPNEASVAGGLSIEGLGTELPSRDRFTPFSQILIDRLKLRRPYYTNTNSVSIGLLILFAVLELYKVEGAQFYFMHPIVGMILGDLSIIGIPLFYFALSSIFIIIPPPRSFIVALELPVAGKFALDHSVRKMIGGVASGISSAIRIDPAYLRVLLLLLNIVTFGIAGVIYLLVQFIVRRRERGEAPVVAALAPRLSDSTNGGETPQLPGKNRTPFNFTIGLLFLSLGVVRVSTEFRLFFFNEPLIQGLAMALAGIAIAWRGASAASLEDTRGKSSISVLAGSSIFFAGIFFIATAIGRVSISFGTHIEIGEIIIGLSFAYLALVEMNKSGRRLAFLFAILLGLCAASVGLHLVPVRDLAAVSQFYDFFYPVIFGILALWSAFEK